MSTHVKQTKGRTRGCGCLTFLKIDRLDYELDISPYLQPQICPKHPCFPLGGRKLATWFALQAQGIYTPSPPRSGSRALSVHPSLCCHVVLAEEMAPSYQAWWSSTMDKLFFSRFRRGGRSPEEMPRDDVRGQQRGDEARSDKPRMSLPGSAHRRAALIEELSPECEHYLELTGALNEPINGSVSSRSYLPWRRPSSEPTSHDASSRRNFGARDTRTPSASRERPSGRPSSDPLRRSGIGPTIVEEARQLPSPPSSRVAMQARSSSDGSRASFFRRGGLREPSPLPGRTLSSEQPTRSMGWGQILRVYST